MYIRRVVIEDIRGFHYLDFDFTRPDGSLSGWNVVTGDNGSGKTALLKAIALAITGPDTSRVLQPVVDGWISFGEKQATIAIHMVAGDRDRFAQGKRFEKPFWSELHFEEPKKRKTVLRPGQRYVRAKRGASRGPWLESPEGWFCAGYGPFRRLYGHSPEAQRIMSTPGKVSRFATLFREDATLAEGDQWLRDLNHRELNGDTDSGETLAQVLEVLNFHFLQFGFRAERVDPDGLWLKQADGVLLPLEHISDGYRAAIAMVVDLIRQAINVYGRNLLSRSNGSLQIRHSGVVLIDEVDAHLHPSWQREIGDWFQQVFPSMQFIVTSHSPLICQTASDRGIYHLPSPGSNIAPFRLSDSDYRKIIGSRPHEILLTPAFGLDNTWSPRAVRARSELALLNAKRAAAKLSANEEQRYAQLSLFLPSQDLNEASTTPTAARAQNSHLPEPATERGRSGSS